MAWAFLLLAGLLEVVGVVGIKRVTLKASLLNYAILIGSFLVSLALLSAAMQAISLSTAYAVWTGIGTVGSTLLGVFFFGESRNRWRLICTAGVIACVIALRLVE